MTSDTAAHGSGSPPRFVVLKFGGTSVSSRSRWEAIAEIVRQRTAEGFRVVVVHSAVRGVTDRLAEAVETPARAEEILDALVALHRDLVDDLGLTGIPVGFQTELDHLARLLADPPRPDSVTSELGRFEAEVLSSGERLCTPLGEAWLRREGLDVRTVDARELLEAKEAPAADVRAWLSATCSTDPDPELRQELAARTGVVLTQGFTARSPAGDTVLLGRGGSDTAAAYLAAVLDAERLEIWSDVPGFFTGDPRHFPDARLIRELDYAEAQEIATTGSRVLHPRCIPALRRRDIPIHLGSSLDPDIRGTVIGPSVGPDRPRLKAISRKDGVVLVTMETLGMWQEVGFLARAFSILANAGLSVDLVTTSETSVTVSLDASAIVLEEKVLTSVVSELSEFCRAEVIRPCTAISLVGRNVRAQLHRLGPALAVFDEYPLLMVSQASSDLNLTFVVEQEHGGRVAERLHTLLLAELRHGDQERTFGPAWLEISGARSDMDGPGEPWWMARSDELLAIAEEHPSAYVYDLATVDRQLERLRGIGSVTRVLYSMKANSHPAILRRVRRAGGGFECVSPGEIGRLRETFDDLRPDEIVFTPNFAPREEYAEALDLGVTVTLDATHPLERWPELFRGREILLRVDPGWGRGHDEKVVTGGPLSKFGIPLAEMDEVRRMVKAAGARVVGLHTHAGSGVLDPDHWARVGFRLLDLAEEFPEVRVINVGGGLGVGDRHGQPEIPLDRLELGLAELARRRPDLELWLEPGRFVVAEAGVLLGHITQIKGKGDRRFVGTTVGMNALIRPALYGSWHPVVNLSRPNASASRTAQIVGPICESGDRIARDRPFPESEEGDVVLIDRAGAYGRVMASTYNLRPIPPEIVLPIYPDSGV